MLMGTCEYTQHRNCSLRVVQSAIKAGRITRNKNGLIDSEQAERDWEANTDAAWTPQVIAGRKQALALVEPSASAPTFMASKARTQTAVAGMKELEFAKRRGDLLDRRQVETAAFQTYRQLCDACMAIPERLASQLAVEGNEEAVRQALEQELRSVFRQFVDGAV
jgi:hypothetical protein